METPQFKTVSRGFMLKRSEQVGSGSTKRPENPFYKSKRNYSNEKDDWHQYLYKRSFDRQVDLMHAQ